MTRAVDTEVAKWIAFITYPEKEKAKSTLSRDQRLNKLTGREQTLNQVGDS